MKRNDNYIVRKIAGETLLVPTGAAARDFSGLVTLNELGAFIWAHLNEAQDVQDLAQKIAAEYEVDLATAQADAQEFLDLLAEQHMVEL